MSGRVRAEADGLACSSGCRQVWAHDVHDLFVLKVAPRAKGFGGTPVAGLCDPRWRLRRLADVRRAGGWPNRRVIVDVPVFNSYPG